MERLGVDKKNVQFAQLKGFSDQVTKTLAAQGYSVRKQLHYGSTEVLMPFLIRRGQESRQVLREQELHRRQAVA